MRRATRWLGVGAMVLGLVGLALAWWAFTGLGEPGAEAGWGPGRYQHPAVVRYHRQVVALYGLGLASGLAGLVAGGLAEQTLARRSGVLLALAAVLGNAPHPVITAQLDHLPRRGPRHRNDTRSARRHQPWIAGPKTVGSVTRSGAALRKISA